MPRPRSWSYVAEPLAESDDRLATCWYTSGMTTTIKVPFELRDRINRDAKLRGVTAAGLIEGLLDGAERTQRMEAFGRAVSDASDEYWDEFRIWDVSLGDGRGGD